MRAIASRLPNLAERPGCASAETFCKVGVGKYLADLFYDGIGLVAGLAGLKLTAFFDQCDGGHREEFVILLDYAKEFFRGPRIIEASEREGGPLARGGHPVTVCLW